DQTGANDLSRFANPNVTVNAAADLFQTAPAVGVVNGTSTANISGVNPMLGPLQNNGGPTQTMALLPGSPAIDHGSNPAGLTTDQRGTGFRRAINGHIDIGAFESQPPATSTTLASSLASSVPGQRVTFTARVSGRAPGSNTPQ